MGHVTLALSNAREDETLAKLFMAEHRHIIGCMTGTSLDALDAALVRIEGRGLAMKATLAKAVSRPLGTIACPLRAFAEQSPMIAGEIARLAHEFSVLHAEVIAELRRSAGVEVDLVCAHGQTVFHRPPLSWQMLNGALVASRAGVPVVFDLRAADLAAGGQGAPITPIADLVLFSDPRENRAVVNLGGFCNFTLLPAGGNDAGEAAGETRTTAMLGAIRAGDVCACNHVLDTIARRVLGRPFDANGAAAVSGQVNDDALDDLVGVFAAQSRAGRSLGTGDEVASWVGRQWKGGSGVSGPHLCATACEAIADAAWRAITGHGLSVDRVLLAGGGARNGGLARAFASIATCPVEECTRHGVPIEAREAVCFAVLGALCQDRVPITLAGVTGVAKAPLAGVWAWP